MKVPPLNLQKQYKKIKKEIQVSINTVCETQAFVLGKTVADFETNFAEYCGTPFAIGCANGTDAILLSLKVFGIHHGDEVLVPSFTFIASAEPIARLGAKPVFVDIDPHTYNIDVNDLEKKITKRTKAIVVVHLYGQTADMASVMRIARKYKLKVLEDACQAVGSIYGPNGKKAGTFGDCAAFSFFPTKNLGGFGDGGIIVTRSKKYTDILRMLRQHGSNKRYYNDLLGMNSRLDALQAAVLDVKLKYLDAWQNERIKRAAVYTELLRKTFQDDVVTPYIEKNNLHTYHQYMIQVRGVEGAKRDRLVTFLQEKGIGSMIYYPVPCHQQKCFSYLKLKKGLLPVTEKVAKRIFSLPIYPELTRQEQAYVVYTIQSGLKEI
jgi:dTDP-4-amino-4,6-dideoxygalactose transaminase